jgi:hypothetical protein
LIAEGAPREEQIALGWMINTHLLLLKLLKDKYEAWILEVKSLRIHRITTTYVLDDMSNNHGPSARPKRANAGKTTSHQSWADVVRPKPSKGSIGGLSSLTKC